MLGMESGEMVFGKRPGEAISCIHAKDNESGCGTSEACRYCNAVNLVLKSISSKSKSSDEVILTVKNQGIQMPFNLFENVTPLTINNQEFYVVALMDISDSKRRRTLEKVFFHDIINTSGGLRGLVSLLKNDVPDSYKQEVGYVEEAFNGLVDDIIGQKNTMRPLLLLPRRLKTKYTKQLKVLLMVLEEIAF